MTAPKIGDRVRIIAHRPPFGAASPMQDLRGECGTVEHVFGRETIELTVRLDARGKRNRSRVVAVVAGEWEVVP